MSKSVEALSEKQTKNKKDWDMTLVVELSPRKQEFNF
jgi:hypothetical protein